jgi:nucleotide-binding universal stress UspA family protein
MYKKILIPTDGSGLAEKAVEHGVALAKAIGARITILTVTRPYPLLNAETAMMLTAETAMIQDTPTEYKARIAAGADETLHFAADMAKAAGVACDTVQVEDDHPYKAIIETAGSKGCDLIVMASHGRRGISALLLGSETVKVLTHCKIPVLVHR